MRFSFIVSPFLLILSYELIAHKAEQQLLRAIHLDDVYKVQRLIKDTIDKEIRDAHGFTPLINAVLHNNLAMVDLLIGAGADFEARDDDGRTPLMLTAHRGYSTVMMKLIEYGANINHQDYDGRTALVFAAERGLEKIVQILLEQETWDKDIEKESLGQALHMAVKQGNSKLVKLLFTGGANVNSLYSDGSSALIWAAHNGDDTMVEALLNAGAVVDLKSTYHLDPFKELTRTGVTPLMAAAQEGHEAIVRMLLDAHARLDTTDDFGRTPLMYAVTAGSHTIVNDFLSRITQVNTQDNQGATALMIAAANGHERYVGLLIQSGANVNVRNAAGENALSLAVIGMYYLFGTFINLSDKKNSEYIAALNMPDQSKYDKIVEMLIHAGINISDEPARTALLVASQQGKNKIVELLVKAGVTPQAKEDELVYSTIESENCLDKLSEKSGNDCKALI